MNEGMSGVLDSAPDGAAVAASILANPHCRHCGEELTLVMADLGTSPIANDYLDPRRHLAAEPIYPLEVRVCRSCRLAQTRDVVRADSIFREDYAYFSSISASWVEHARRYVEAMSKRFKLGKKSTIVEIASNDGYLLQFVQAAGMRCLGVEPCESVAAAARDKGIETLVAFFGVELAEKLLADGYAADLITANNVLAHVPDINDFLGGVAKLLKPEGVATFEFPHLLRVMERNHFDTIYHEHFSYLSLIAGQRIFAKAGLRIFDVEDLTTHGGSIRFFACRNDAAHKETPNIARTLDEERAYGLDGDARYIEWCEGVAETKRRLLDVLIPLKRAGKRIAGYGAAAKGVTLLNYCGVGGDFLDFIADRAPSKQGRLMPGVRVPILSPDRIFAEKPDYILILPWNLKEEVKAQMAAAREWGCKFIVPIPVPVIED
ncbi:MAG: class I SAM-dependent methyltransferase [Hyphomonadaceae bacterium]|nr:class I SAM-dependent methyltransferase [Hyphomonadaceae bacterium]